MTEHKIEAIVNGNTRFIYCYTHEERFVGKDGMNNLIRHLAETAGSEIRVEEPPEPEAPKQEDPVEAFFYDGEGQSPEEEEEEEIAEASLDVEDDPEDEVSPLEKIFASYKSKKFGETGVAFEHLDLTVISITQKSEPRTSKSGRPYRKEYDLLKVEDSAGRKVEVRLFGDDRGRTTPGDQIHFTKGWYKVYQGNPIVTKGRDRDPKNPIVSKVSQFA